MRVLNQRLISPFSAHIEYEPEFKYHSQYQSIGHEVLISDRRAENISDSVFQRLDTVISRVVTETTIDTINNIDEARTVLGSIEASIVKSNFLCSIPYYLVHSFSQGLQPQPLDQRVVCAAENELRRPHILAHESELFSHTDCDLGSLLYLSIAEVLTIPLQMVEVPQHNFVRCRLDDGTYLNWDTNYGFNKFTNDEYAARYNVTPGQVAQGTYLSDLSRENSLGYFCFVRGITFERSKQYADAVGEYQKAIALYPQSPSGRNNLAWLFVISRDVQRMFSGDEAIKLAKKACELHRSDNQLDTLACVLAECGHFDEAVKVETEAYQLNPQPSYLEMISAFRERKTWLDVHGT